MGFGYDYECCKKVSLEQQQQTACKAEWKTPFNHAGLVPKLNLTFIYFISKLSVKAKK
jgi:hypothetical protein